jgi:Uma2 family endonuclease
MQMAPTKVWTLAELHSLPDDGNTYELIRGELFVTPAPAFSHESILARLVHVLVPFVEAQGLGRVYPGKPVVRRDGSEAQPDLVVGDVLPPDTSWDDVTLPILVVEIASPSTWRRDRGPKRSYYMDLRIAEYWIIDGESQTVAVVRPDQPDLLTRDTYGWRPAGASASLVIEVSSLFVSARR